jgi:predicted chitinase
MSDLEQFKNELRQIFQNASSSNIDRYALPILETMKRYDISTPLRQKHFLAQIGHESGELHHSEEIASGAAYEGRRDLGNTRKGDGRKFKGQGLIQITGRYNITEFDKFRKLNGTLVDNPRLIGRDPFLSADAAGWFWHTRSINTLADRNDIIAVTKRINGGTNGLAHRRMLFARANRVLSKAYFPDSTTDTTKEPTKENNLTVEKPSKIPTIKEVQIFLSGYFGISLTPDGKIGARTKSAIKEFQSKNGLESTGILNSATKILIGKLL